MVTYSGGIRSDNADMSSENGRLF